ncbi:MAG: 3-oxoacyl-ACP reductase [Nevskia sp.]|uniref:3-oxoacyl-ACP reductase n=1 Tax=Nevskia sp. TaxID=1929292 RepID=UPI0040365118
MSDRYLDFTQSAFGKSLSGLLGLPQPPRLRRATGPYAARPLDGQAVMLGSAANGELAAALLVVLKEAGAIVQVATAHAGLTPIKAASAATGISLKTEPNPEDRAAAPVAFIFDATGIADATQLRALYDFLQPRVGRIPANGRVLLLGRAPADAGTPAAAAAAAALRGFTRSFGKEIGKKGATVNLIEVGRGAEDALAGPLRFLLSPHAAYITGQTLVLNAPAGDPASKFFAPLSGKVAVVTGAARGIGAAIAATLAREGAQVVGIDRPQEEGALGETLSAFGGFGLALDITAADAPQRIAQELTTRFGGIDIVVHNAGITRDKMLKNMAPHLWDMVLDVNFGAILRINDALLAHGLNDGARMVCISSIGGIAGNAGQTNYGATKAGVMGYVEAMAPVMARRGGAINAVAPGFIETAMTAQMPTGPREVGRRLASLGQGGLPIDIAEAVTFLASPLANAVNGRTLRVCGQNFVGA